MAIITLSRGSRSGGLALAEQLAQCLKYDNIISREVLVKTSEEYGIAERDLNDAMQKPPHLFERSAHNPRRAYLTLIRATLLGYAQSGDLIYHGNAGQFLLRDVSWVLKLKLIAPMEQRIAALMKTQILDRFEAMQQIKKIDEDRTRWTKFLYDEDWNDPVNFDLVINLATMSIRTAAEMVCRLAVMPEFAATPDRTRDIADKALAARVQAAFELNPKTAGTEVIVNSEDGLVRLSGKLSSSSLKPLIVQTAQEVPGVIEVRESFIH